MSGLKRPGFVSSPSANASVLAGDVKFLKMKDGESMMLRFLPAPKEDGIIFYPTTNHYGLKNQDGKDVALACLHQHGGADSGKECLLCAVHKYLADNAEVLELDSETSKRLNPSTRYYTQVLVANIVDRKVRDWTGPKLIAWSKTAAQNIQTVFENQEKFGTPVGYDIDKGQALIVTRTGSGFTTKYAAERTGDVLSLDTIRPTWTTEFMEDLYAEIGLNIATPVQQAAYLRISMPALDWDAIFSDLGFSEEE